MSERKVSHEYGTIPHSWQSLEIEAYWKENVVNVFIGINALGAVEGLMKKQAIYTQQIQVAG